MQGLNATTLYCEIWGTSLALSRYFPPPWQWEARCTCAERLECVGPGHTLKRKREGAKEVGRRGIKSGRSDCETVCLSKKISNCAKSTKIASIFPYFVIGFQRIKMLFNNFLTTLALVGSATAHYRLLAPTWRGDSFKSPASQYTFPCGGVNETLDINNRTLWPLTSGSVKINGSHTSALTFINLALGTNVTGFNITLVDGFNQTGAGVFCLKEAGRGNLEAGVRLAGYSGLDDKRLEGLEATVQVVQLGHSGSALYNCADVRFSANATLLADDQCRNDTGVGASAIGNVNSSAVSSSPSATRSGTAAASSAAGVALKPFVGTGLLAGALAWGLL